MPKRLQDGERKVIHASKLYSIWKHNSFVVEAERIDSETPVVHLTIASESLAMTDTETYDLIDRLQRALSVLPTSK